MPSYLYEIIKDNSVAETQHTNYVFTGFEWGSESDLSSMEDKTQISS